MPAEFTESESTMSQGAHWGRVIRWRKGKADNDPEPKKSKSSPRIQCLDAFRGLTVFLMLLVNNIVLDDLAPEQLTHSAWNQGLHLADFVFPWFLLCVGLSIPLSFSSHKKSGNPDWRLDLRIGTRTVVLFVLGLLVNCAMFQKWFFSLGVLQLIAMDYFLAAYLYELPALRRLIIAGLCFVSYGAAILFLPIPGAKMGSFTEQANFFGHINTTYLVQYNIDGLFSTIPTTGLLLVAGLVLPIVQSERLTHVQRVLLLVSVGGLLATLGAWSNEVIPYNTPVWTPSYVLLTSGVGFMILAAFYCLLDWAKWSKLALPLNVLGSNAILAYCAPIFIKLTVLTWWSVPSPKGRITAQQALIDGLTHTYGKVGGGWTYTGLYIGVWWLILWLLYRFRLFVRV